ncbi:hypothetical protein KFK14_11460 [Sphingobium phenoxybenzoativorans]|uniref:Uncharacterized protein n=1 Tax=Sphingobium phenoxybenzoativorans TaxID=1592790 RepID=A0A975Q3P3_9SPHN|nr:hypothetical protein [Sphingobium phenoxybenzoativorans]QUT07946.1 hypothetical protein KFK14_11460 [Sphingobium phenoxybenzoativorans]
MSGQRQARIKIEITRKPPPPPLDPFECLACRQMIERDPYTPEFQEPPICWQCAHAIGGRTQLAHLPYEAWGQFRKAQALLNLIKMEVAHVRKH